MRTISPVFLVLLLMAGGANGQMQTEVRAGAEPLAAGNVAGNPVQSQAPSSADNEGTGRRAWKITPRVTLQETLTDNVSPGNGDKTSDQITELAPGVRVDGRTARLKLHLDYQLRQLHYAQGARDAQTQHALNSFGTLEAIDNLLFVDLNGTISRQNISAFGVQSPAYYSDNNNSTETRNFRISPYIRGSLGTYADYEARYSRSALRAKSELVSNSDTQEWLGRAKGNTRLSFLNWSVDASRQCNDYAFGRTTESDRLSGRLIFRVDPQLRLSAGIGRESNDFLGLDKQSYNTSGFGFDWAPNQRTQVSAFREKRFFGHGHNVSVSHRLPLSAIKFTDTRDVSSQSSQLSMGQLGNIYDLLFNQMTSTIPNAADRAAAIDSFLLREHISPSTQVYAGFLSSQVTLNRRQDLSYILRGVRNTLTLSANRSRNERLGTGFGALSDDFATVSAVVQQGVSIGWSHRLTALSSLSLTASRSRNTGERVTAGQDPENTSKALSLTFTTKLGAQTNAALSARRTEVDSAATTLPYSENALVGSLSHQF